MFLFWLSDQLGMLFRQPFLAEAIAVGLVFCLLSAGLAANVSAINPQTTLVGPSDIRALDWINDHLPADARFFVNTTPWGYGVSRGVDGGAWILPYTGRWSIAPTVFYPFGMDMEGKKETMDWGERAAKVGTCDDQFWDLVKEEELTYAFLSEKAGILQPQVMEDCVGAKRLYQADGVSVWHLDMSANSGK
jgi:hypothetical protein